MSEQPPHRETHQLPFSERHRPPTPAPAPRYKRRATNFSQPAARQSQVYSISSSKNKRDAFMLPPNQPWRSSLEGLEVIPESAQTLQVPFATVMAQYQADQLQEIMMKDQPRPTNKHIPVLLSPLSTTKNEVPRMAKSFPQPPRNTSKPMMHPSMRYSVARNPATSSPALNATSKRAENAYSEDQVQNTLKSIEHRLSWLTVHFNLMECHLAVMESQLMVIENCLIRADGSLSTIERCLQNLEATISKMKLCVDEIEGCLKGKPF